MPRKLLLLLVFVLIFQNSYSQTTSEDQNAKFSLILRGGILDTYLYNPLFYWAVCIEGCSPEEQSSKIGKSFNLGLVYQLSEKNQIAALTGYSEFGYYEKGIASTGAGSYSYESNVLWKFWGVEIEYIRALYRIGKVSLLLGNGLRFETPIQDYSIYNDKIMKAVGINYNGRLGAEFKISNKISLLGNGLFKTSLSKYNKVEPAFDYSNYKPYGIGGEIGVSVNF